MAVKTITLELDAYEKLRRARRGPRDSFSNVVRRGRWDDAPLTGQEIIESLTALAKENPDVLLDDKTLDEMDRRKRTVRRKTRWEA